MRCEEAQEMITASIDGELNAAERRALEDHLGACVRCQRQREREAALKQSLRQASAAVATPPHLRQAISEKIGTFAGNGPRLRRIGFADGWIWPSLRPAAVCALVIAVIAAVLFQVRWKSDLTEDALAVYRDVAAGKALARVNDPAKLKADLARAVENRFAPVSPDLSALKLFPVAGFARKIGGRDVLVTVYEGGGHLVLCFTFPGDEADAPKGASALFDPERQVHFYWFSRGAVSAVMHRVGGVNCLLVADMPAAALLAAARGKDRHA
ncbi:MAG TPA: zf-HC2 domain-containing protein [Candidatus Binatia bacterium]|nr:zf-HC2 domain-containing protein [Candidatus Binatia bacterium]